jgi:hypothetical protein
VTYCHFLNTQYDKVRENKFIISYDDKLNNGMEEMKLRKRVTNNLIMDDAFFDDNTHLALSYYNEAINTREKLESFQKDI